MKKLILTVALLATVGVANATNSSSDTNCNGNGSCGQTTNNTNTYNNTPSYNQTANGGTAFGGSATGGSATATGGAGGNASSSIGNASGWGSKSFSPEASSSSNSTNLNTNANTNTNTSSSAVVGSGNSANSNVNKQGQAQGQAQKQSQIATGGSVKNSGNSTNIISTGGNKQTNSQSVVSGNTTVKSGNQTVTVGDNQFTVDAAKVAAQATVDAATITANANGDRDAGSDAATIAAAKLQADAIRYASEQKIYNTPSVNAPALTSSNDTCMGSSSGSVNIPGLGIGGGTTWVDNNCRMLKNSRELWNMGMKAAAMALMCTDAANKEALELTGFKCPQSKRDEESRAAMDKAALYNGTDPIVRARLGMSVVDGSGKAVTAGDGKPVKSAQ